MRAVVDTNVWISALINPKGAPARALTHTTACDLVTSEEILAELERVLQYERILHRYNLNEEMIKAYLTSIRADSEVIAVTNQVTAVERDPLTTSSWPVLKRAKPITLCRVTHILSN